ncbi:hypothetical protein HRR83_004690 [Exophiala dermatitidis]|uniref:Uncharacterized protein n=1 Tax=Exophiala dermatitidis TaxID=5970 RepID=A0AAN6F286_EXODE|nr:hypothetical protein HRR74_004028 [Exophiala dermatitidis]KAJ4529103.1 hypothetical protein HRR73_000123 [Exophiala dermatitidis]KAJ4538503.1 hypothetical protein HRR77_006986 [Exophiala dermatitidis]KAJ4544251.1 hypothetical protein HRR76_002317 [Exophiala dermatitidis]KAJ4561670.1 hypothetical protein HRR79_007007 [Exophiala dermatitidis]
MALFGGEFFTCQALSAAQKTACRLRVVGNSQRPPEQQLKPMSCSRPNRTWTVSDLDLDLQPQLHQSSYHLYYFNPGSRGNLLLHTRAGVCPFSSAYLKSETQPRSATPSPTGPPFHPHPRT